MEKEEDKTISELISLTGKTTIVTGGAQGIGYAISRRFLESGATVIIADTDESTGQQAAQSLAGSPGKVSFVRCDITDESRVREVMAKTAAANEGIDVLVNNAGVYPRKSLIEMTGDDFRRVVDINLTGTFLCCRYSVPYMIEKNRGGCIVNIASIEAVHPSSTGMSAYDAAKAGVVMLTKSLARELGYYGIRVNAVAPGGIITRAIKSHLSDIAEEEQKSQLKELKDFMKRMALGRMGEADDIARVVLFLSSDLAGYITGDLITVDGGYLVS